jgi:hypothetical protein
MAGLCARAAALAGTALLAVLVGMGATQPPAAGGWLDQPLAIWNRAGAAVPRAPAVEGAAANLTRCGEWGRPPTLAADRAVREAGWTLFGPAQVFADTTVVMAMADVDGMCRPLQYQVFVFAQGRYAGSLSPVPMNSRTDGALSVARLFRPGEIVAEFARYGPADPLCCPSRTSTASYRIDRTSRGPVVAPTKVSTSDLRP